MIQRSGGRQKASLACEVEAGGPQLLSLLLSVASCLDLATPVTCMAVRAEVFSKGLQGRKAGVATNRQYIIVSFATS